MISPSIGRKVWFWPVNEPGMAQHNSELALDATVIYPESDTSACLSITDHAGTPHVRNSVYLHQGDVASRPASSCATWMPYQLQQVAKPPEMPPPVASDPLPDLSLDRHGPTVADAAADAAGEPRPDNPTPEATAQQAQDAAAALAVAGPANADIAAI